MVVRGLLLALMVCACDPVRTLTVRVRAPRAECEPNSANPELPPAANVSITEVCPHGNYQLGVTDSKGKVAAAHVGYWELACELHIESSDPRLRRSVIKVSDLCADMWCHEMYLSIDLQESEPECACLREGDLRPGEQIPSK